MGVKLFADFFFREGGAEGKTIDMFSVIFRHFPSCVRLTSAAASSCFLRVDSKIIRRWMDLEGKKTEKFFMPPWAKPGKWVGEVAWNFDLLWEITDMTGPGWWKKSKLEDNLPAFSSTDWQMVNINFTFNLFRRRRRSWIVECDASWLKCYAKCNTDHVDFYTKCHLLKWTPLVNF